ncbi:MAG: PorP/SprF family type IX secretion system membrane protein [Cyclobacteriaceae bacterium]
MLKKLTLLAFFITSIPLMGQDMQYSQFYAAPLQLNPAMTGVSELTRMGANYRKQWPGLQYDFQGFSAYMDHYSFDWKSGFGVSLNSFQESNLNIRLTDFSLFYAYRLDLTEDLNLRFGTQAAWVRRHAAMDHLLLSDQINVLSQTVAPVTMDDIPNFEPYSYLDVSFGGLLTGERFWLGGSAYHVTQPYLSFYSDRLGGRLPIKYNFHSGFVIPINQDRGPFADKSENMLSLSGNYKHQGPFQQLDVSAQVLYEKILIGAGFRGIPGQADLPNRDSVIGLLGFVTNGGLMVGYSFDYMVSRLGMVTDGAHEISLRYQFFKGLPQSRGQESRILKCFQYMM